ncbi:MAG: adenylate/guanylate cyclase domain-containing protein [Alphaproteobacteria bacterium]|nr:adenylate/guanylate cyclase domain-containing protein [Alphaproteobacteria bacterium]
MELEDGRTHGGGSLIDATADWLMAEALGDAEMQALFEGTCTRLAAAGIPLSRVNLAFGTLHPLVAAVSLTWTRDRPLVAEGFPHGREDSPAWVTSPYRHMMERRVPFLRRRLTGDHAQLDFPIMTELRDRGATEYLAIATPFKSRPADWPRQPSSSEGILASWATDHPPGFSAQDQLSLLRIQRRLAVACKVAIQAQIARNVATTYLGPTAGARVLDGQIKRGDHDTIHAVIWYSDLRRSTQIADSMPALDYLTLLNTYFECTAGAILAERGDVLGLVGDSVLAIFPTGSEAASERAARASALAASRNAHQRLAEINRTRAEGGLDPLAFGIALHMGEVMYGNIGVPERLEFSAVGPSVNEAARSRG